MRLFSKSLWILLIIILVGSPFRLDFLSFSAADVSVQAVRADTGDDSDAEDDYDLYQKYDKYLKYEKRKKYRKYKEAKEKYGFSSTQEKLLYKDRYEKYALYKKYGAKYAKYAGYWSYYKKYRGYKNIYKDYKKYAKFKKYNQAKYDNDKYKNYGKAKYEEGYKRYKAKKNAQGEASLGGGNLGPEITVGIFSTGINDLDDTPFKIKSEKAYVIKDGDGKTLATINGNTSTRVSNVDKGTLRVYDSCDEKKVAKMVTFEAADGDNGSIIFDVNKPGSDFDNYRGKISVRIDDDKTAAWVINTLPLEQYVWGMGEITGTGPAEYNRVMTTAYRTYGYWKIKYSTKNVKEGFKVTATSSSQIYYGYDWETRYSRIREAAEVTRGTIVMYKDRIAITPYSSWTDGKTRSWEDRWGSDNYPWCQSVKDPYGKHPSKSTEQLEAEGNHMVGMSAHGALTLADDEHWDWQRILKYYYEGIDLTGAY